MKLKIFLIFIFIILTASGGYIRLPTHEPIPPTQKLQDIIKQIHTEREVYYRIKNEWEEKKMAMQEEIETLEKEYAYLKTLLDEDRKVTNQIKKRLYEMKKPQREEKILEEKFLPIFLNTLNRLEKIVEKDLPFHILARKKRIEEVRSLLKNKEKSIAEKFKQLWQILLIELSYADTCEVYEDTIKINNEKKLVKILRIGKIAMFYETLDKKEYGIFSDYKWQKIPNRRLIGQIREAFAIIEKTKPATIVTLPLQTCKE